MKCLSIKDRMIMLVTGLCVLVSAQTQTEVTIKGKIVGIQSSEVVQLLIKKDPNGTAFVRVAPAGFLTSNNVKFNLNERVSIIGFESKSGNQVTIDARRVYTSRGFVDVRTADGFPLWQSNMNAPNDYLSGTEYDVTGRFGSFDDLQNYLWWNSDDTFSLGYGVQGYGNGSVVRLGASGLILLGNHNRGAIVFPAIYSGGHNWIRF